MNLLNHLIWLVLIGLPSTSAAQSWSSQSLGGTSVHLYRPASAGAVGAGRSLVVGLHGCSQQATDLRDRGNWEPAADAFGAVVALPQVPNGGVLIGCWDYYGTNHSRTNRHNGALLEIVQGLLQDASLGIDANQVYLAGLSSGAGETAVMGCLAPDVFAGIGINAGPAVGTASSEPAMVSTTAAEAEQVCRTFAGANTSFFATQVATIIHGTSDYIVATGYADLNAQVLGSLYGASTAGSFDVTQLEGYQPRGTGEQWSDGVGPRVSLIKAEGMGHAFPAGSGAGHEQAWVATEGVAWPTYLLRFFAANNRRITGPRPDAGVVTRDTGVPPIDSGVPPIDAGHVDGSQSDATVAEIDSGSTSTEEEGCSCAVSQPNLLSRSFLSLLIRR